MVSHFTMLLEVELVLFPCVETFLPAALGIIIIIIIIIYIYKAQNTVTEKNSLRTSK